MVKRAPGFGSTEDLRFQLLQALTLAAAAVVEWGKEDTDLKPSSSLAKLEEQMRRAKSLTHEFVNHHQDD